MFCGGDVDPTGIVCSLETHCPNGDDDCAPPSPRCWIRDMCDVRDHLTFEEGGYIGRPTHEDMALAMNLTYPSDDVSVPPRYSLPLWKEKGGGLTTSFPVVFFFARKRSHPITTSAVSPSTRRRCVARARAPINRRRRAGKANSATAAPPAITGSRPVTASRLRRRTSRPPRRSRTTARRITASAAQAGPTPTRVGSGGAAVRITAARTARAASPTRRATSWTGSLRPPRRRPLSPP